MRPSFFVAPALFLTAALAACGSSSSSGSSASSSSSSTSSPSSSSSSSSSESSGSAAASPDPASVVLTTGALPSGDGTWTLHSDGQLNNIAATRARSWTSSNAGQALEIDVAVDGSEQVAQADWGTWQSKIADKVSGGQPSTCPTGAPSNCIELNGTWATQTNETAAVLAWQQSNVLVAVVLIDSRGTASKGYAEDVSSREGDLIGTVVGG